MRTNDGGGRTGMTTLVLLLGALAACGRGNETRIDSHAGGASAAAPPAAATATPNADFSALTDPNIAATISIINSGEIEAAQLVAQKGASADIKAFARDMIAEHSELQKSVDSLTAARNLAPLPSPMGETIKNDAKDLRRRLSELTGTAFDSAYVHAQVIDHQKALKALTGMAAAAQDADIRAALQGALPKIQAHFDRARRLAGVASGVGDAKMRDTTHH